MRDLILHCSLSQTSIYILYMQNSTTNYLFLEIQCFFDKLLIFLFKKKKYLSRIIKILLENYFLETIYYLYFSIHTKTIKNFNN